MSFPFTRVQFDRAVTEDSNGIDSVNMVNCPRKRGILSPGRKAASPIDTALNKLYRSCRMSPDSQLEQIPPDSQLERFPQGPHVVAHAHSTDMSENVGGTDAADAPTVPTTFPDTLGKPETTLLYGYYLAASDTWFGNRGHALSARHLWKRFHGKATPQPLEGCAIWTVPGGQCVVRTIVRNFFTGAYMVFDRYPKVGPLTG